MSALPAIPIFSATGAALIASPSTAVREHVLQRLNGRCRPVEEVLGGADALAKLEKGEWEVLFLDRRLPDLEVEELLTIIGKRFPGIHVVLLDSGCENTELETLAPEYRRADSLPHRSPRRLQNISNIAPLPGMIGNSEAMQRVYRMVRLVAARSTTVLVAGATGTGKELVARSLHALSPRSPKPFVVVNCAAIPEALLESELFGFTRGAFTGAVQSQLGRIPAAHGGTLFLDEVSELPFGMQAKLLRFLEQKEIQRLGSCEVTRVDVRVIAASNVDLAQRAVRHEFRQDLYYRLSAFPVELPPLSERRGDIIPLAEYFLGCISAAQNLPTPKLTDEAVRMLENNSWQGNVRELQHVMERASILAADEDVIDAPHLFFSGPESSGLRAMSAHF